MIDWLDPKSKISEHFSVHDACYLPQFQCYHQPSENEKKNIILTANKMEEIRAVLNRPINVHCWIRPICVVNTSSYSGRNYNSFVQGAPKSAHIDGIAVDWNPSAMTCGDARAILAPMLEELQIRMENRDGNWVHTDLRTPPKGTLRFFRP